MWMTPYPWCVLLGVLAYAAMAWAGKEPRARDPGQLVLVAGCLFGLSTLLLVGAWYFANSESGITPVEFLSADSLKWQYRRHIYLFYAFSLSTALCVVHVLVLRFMPALGKRQSS